MNLINFASKQKIYIFLLFSIISALKMDILKTISEISPVYISNNGMYPWAILFLCIFFLILNRRKISNSYFSIDFSICGIIIYIISFYIPANAPEFGIFRILLSWAGLAFVFFGEAAFLPALQLCIFGFGIAFPVLIDRYIGLEYSQFSTFIAYNIASIFLDITKGDTYISMITLSGDQLVMIINKACSGSASMSVFLVIFMLMSLDFPVQKTRWTFMLFLGIIGTFLQNILRLVLLMFIGHHFGPNALESGENLAGYIVFPVWYAIFAAYLKYYEIDRQIL